MGGNDPGSIAFAIKKRLKGRDENPSIILVDGGKSQLNAITSKIIDQDILLLAIEKGSKRRSLTETIYSINGQESIETNSRLFNVLMKARDEAHRFAIMANRNSKRKNMHSSILDSVKGIGPKIKERLFNRFKSIDVILTSKEEDLLNIKGINKQIAKDISKLKK